MANKAGTGKWQQRIIRTLKEANGPVTMRQLYIRCGAEYADCGVAYANNSRQKTNFRQCMSYLTYWGSCRRIAHGVYVLEHKGERTP